MNAGPARPPTAVPGLAGRSFPGRAWRGALRDLGGTVARSLRLVGSQCCVGRADVAWRRARDREPPG
jgi:hypothetical protein